jgi:hypothetical protein
MAASKDKAARMRELNLKIPQIRVGGEIVDLPPLTALELRAFKQEYPGIVADPEKEKPATRKPRAAEPDPVTTPPNDEEE